MKIATIYLKCATIIILVALTLFLRLAYLDRFLTADEKRWQANVAGFTNKLAHGRLAELVQQPHPGITMQWFAAATVSSDNWAIRKLPLVLWQCVLLVGIAYATFRLLGFWPAAVSATALALDPMLIAHTRVYAMDSLLAQFALLSLLLLCLAESSGKPRYFIAAGAAAAAAVLSKLPGIVLMPVSLGYIIITYYNRPKPAAKTAAWYLMGFIIGAGLILPSLALHPWATIGDFAEFFRSDDYTELHQASPWYYTGTYLYIASPWQWATAAAAIGLALSRKTLGNQRRRQLTLLLGFAVIFALMMSAGSKKGDRYILPAFVALDATAAWLVYWYQKNNRGRHLVPAALIMGGLLAWQAGEVIKLTPYTLAYVNPITKPWLAERRLGWGEGLDLAADYLNQKPHSAGLKVAVNYPVEFAYRFRGQAVPLHQWENASVNYAVIYRASLQRRPDSWEQDVLNHFQTKTPEKIIYLNNIPYAWIYKLSPPQD